MRQVMYFGCHASHPHRRQRHRQQSQHQASEAGALDVGHRRVHGPKLGFAHVEKEGATWTAPRWILLDIQMPGVDGFAWLEHFRTLPESVQSMCRIYMLSASIDREELRKAEADPSVIALMEKPLDVYMFRQLLDL